ncbi:MAG: LytTR family transcriptional regulator [Rhizobium sp.]|nr:LytTR family transcriptional regulator [Rhizobium sp.]
MNSPFLQSTLREMQILARSPRLWLTFGAVVLLFAVTGPYGSAERLAFVPRLGYWLLLHAGAWSFALLFSVIADVMLQARLGSMFLRMLIGSVAATLPIGLVIGLLEWSWFGVPLTLPRYLQALPTILPLSGIFCVISYLAMSGDGVANVATAGPATGAASGPAAEGGPAARVSARPFVPLLDRLKPGNRGPLQHISVEDHYSRIRTARGSELILLRFSDALRETGDADGLQVHRSHWVAREFVAGYRSTNGRLSLVLLDGTDVPVSRAHADTVRSQFIRAGNEKTRAD